MRYGILIATLIFCSCSRLDEFNQQPELGPLEDGFKASAAIAYAVSIAHAAFTGEVLPPNVTFQSSNTEGYSSSGLIYVNVASDHRMPFNSNIGDIIIAGIWDGQQGGGVISIFFGDFDILGKSSRLYGIHTIPVTRSMTGDLIAVFAEQDILVGEGSQSILEIDPSRAKFDIELERTKSAPPSDAFIVVRQNVWHLTIDTNNPTVLTDDIYEVSGGGQIVGVESESGGVLYHAMIDCRFSFAECTLNPIGGTAFIQNFKAGDFLDLGGILLDFDPVCDGKARIQLATGKYATSNGRTLTLNWN